MRLYLCSSTGYNLILQISKCFLVTSTLDYPSFFLQTASTDIQLICMQWQLGLQTALNVEHWSRGGTVESVEQPFVVQKIFEAGKMTTSFHFFPSTWTIVGQLCTIGLIPRLSLSQITKAVQQLGKTAEDDLIYHYDMLDVGREEDTQLQKTMESVSSTVSFLFKWKWVFVSFF